MRLAKREKLVVFGGTGLLVSLLVWQFAVRPVMERASTVRRVVAEKREVLAQLRAKRLEYEKLQTERGRLHAMVARQQGNRRILSSIESARKTCGLSENVLSMKPATAAIDNAYEEVVVDVRLEGLTLAQLAQLVSFLSQLGAADATGGVTALEVRRADRGSARADDDSSLLAATVSVAAVTHAQHK
jgi:type II secretory pathway component PulM